MLRGVIGRPMRNSLEPGHRGDVDDAAGTALEHLRSEAAAEEKKASTAKADLSSLSSMLQNRWKGGESGVKAKPEALQSGQVRSFRITKLDREAKKIELELAQ